MAIFTKKEAQLGIKFHWDKYNDIESTLESIKTNIKNQIELYKLKYIELTIQAIRIETFYIQTQKSDITTSCLIPHKKLAQMVGQINKYPKAFKDKFSGAINDVNQYYDIFNQVLKEAK